MSKMKDKDVEGRKKDQLQKPKAKSVHPPIETFFHLPHTKEKNASSSLKAKLMTLRLSFLRRRKTPSMKTILQGSHSPKDQEIVDAFRELLVAKDQIIPKKNFDYHTLLRFLRMRDFDIVQARDAFLNYLKWRKEFSVDAIDEEFKFVEHREVKKCYPHGYHEVDRYGRPLYIERIGMVDLERLLQATTIERFVKNHVAEQEKTLKWRYPACSIAAKKHIASTTSILDVKDLGMSNFSKPARQIFMEIQKIDSNYYPETLHRLFIINAGSGFMVLWKAIKAFLDSRTVTKIQVLGSNYEKELIKVIDKNNLPSFLGGNCMCSHCGGCLLSDKGPWNDPDITQMLQTMLDAEESEDKESNYQVQGMEIAKMQGNIHIKDVCDIASTRDGTIRQTTQTTPSIDYSFLEKIQACESVLENAKIKILRLEVALEDTKLALTDLEQHMEELKK